MKTEILKLIQDKPKHFSILIKKDEELYSWVMQNSVATSDDFVVHIFSSISGKNNICPLGNTRRYISINSDDFGFCGRAAKCQCCKNSVSEAVTQQKALITSEQQLEINKKREDTWRQLSGGTITNAGQTAKALATRQQLNQSNDYKQMVVDKRKATCIARFGADNINSTNPFLEQLRDKSQCENLFVQCNQSLKELANTTGLSEKTVRVYLQKHELIAKKNKS